MQHAFVFKAIIFTYFFPHTHIIFNASSYVAQLKKLISKTLHLHLRDNVMKFRDIF